MTSARDDSLLGELRELMKQACAADSTACDTESQNREWSDEDAGRALGPALPVSICSKSHSSPASISGSTESAQLVMLVDMCECCDAS